MEQSSKIDSIIYTDKLKYLLFVLPIIYGVLSFIYYSESGAFFATYPDSTYIYLINGMNIAGGNFDIGHIDNPGTPAHLLVGLIVFIAHLFIGNGPVHESVLSDPELYLRICTVVSVTLLLLSVYASGRLILKHTGKIYTALFFQLVPISSYIVIIHFGRIIPEYLIITALTYYCAVLWVVCYKRNTGSELFNNRNLILFFSFITALLITSKMTCLPFLFLPLFFIKKNLPKIAYLFMTVFFGALLIFPILSRLPEMIGWFSGLATHSGAYGRGEEELFNMSTLLLNLNKLFTVELFFSFGYAIILIAVIVGLVRKKWSDNFYKLTLAVWLTITLQLILAAKHFSFHYIIPSQLLIIPGIAAAYMALIKYKPKTILIYTTIVVCASWLILKTYQNATVFNGSNKLYESSFGVKKYDHLPKIITTGYTQSSFVQSALNFGSCYGGNQYHNSYSFLRKRYPDSYFYSTQENYFKWWDKDIDPAELFEMYPQMLVYFWALDEYTTKECIEKITAGYGPLVKSVDLIEYNPATTERFYMLNIDTSKSNPHYIKKQTVFCDFENKTTDNSAFLSSDGYFKFSGIESVSTEQHFSGVNSVKTSSKNSYGPSTSFAAKSGDVFDISVKCYYSSGRPGGINLLNSNGAIFNKSSESIVEDHGNGWKTINLKATIPENYPETEVIMCLYYYGTQTCYFDDLNVVILKQQ